VCHDFKPSLIIRTVSWPILILVASGFDTNCLATKNSCIEKAAYAAQQIINQNHLRARDSCPAAVAIRPQPCAVVCPKHPKTFAFNSAHKASLAGLGLNGDGISKFLFHLQGKRE